MKVHLIGNAHLDPVWLWQWQEGFSEVLATFRSALDRMKEFDDFVFTCAGALYYEWVEKTDPDMFEEIRQRVHEGRWIIVGGWMIQPDCNVPCGESFARHSLYGQSYFKEKFGVTASVGYNVDSFGHSAMIPQILRKSGMNAYVYMRPGNGSEMRYPFDKHSFIWISPDGSKVKAYRIPVTYNSLGNDDAAVRAKREHDTSEKIGQPMMSFYGVGNHGGGPTIENILSLLKLKQQENGDNYIFSSPNHFFQSLENETLPEFKGDLFHHASGCYSAVSKIKQMNRMSESNLLSAERSDALAFFAGVKKDSVSLKEVWKSVLFNHFHDIICGCCVRSAVNDALHGFSSAVHLAQQAENNALQKIAWNIDTSREIPVVLDKQDFRVWENNNKGTPVIVFNTHAFPVTAPVKLHAAFASVEDEKGSSVCQEWVRGEQTNGQSDKYVSEIMADIPAMGWKLYWGYLKKGTAPVTENMSKPELENEYLRIRFSDDHFISEIWDKKHNKPLLTGKVTPLIINDEKSDTWAHGIFTFDQVEGTFDNTELIFARQTPLAQYIRVQYRYGASNLCTDFILYNNENVLRINCNLNWQEKHRILKLSFPVQNTFDHHVASVPYGFTARPADGKEEPMQKWLAITDPDGYGLGIATDFKTAYSLSDSSLRFTCARSTLFADHFGGRDEYGEYSDLGEQSFSFVVKPLDHDWYNLEKFGEVLVKPLPAILGTYHTGPLPVTASYINVDKPNIIITSFKRAEDSNGWILHAHEAEGKNTDALFTVDSVSFTASFGCQEIKAFRITDECVSECDFMEKPVK